MQLIAIVLVLASTVTADSCVQSDCDRSSIVERESLLLSPDVLTSADPWAAEIGLLQMKAKRLEAGQSNLTSFITRSSTVLGNNFIPKVPIGTALDKYVSNWSKIQEMMQIRKRMTVWKHEYTSRVNDAWHGISQILFCWALLIGLALCVSVSQLRPSYELNSTLLRATSLDTGALSGIRCPLAFLILLFHMGLIEHPSVVTFFFVLSGCTLSVSRCSSPGQVKSPFTSVQRIVQFWIVRIMRLLPVYWFTLACQLPSAGVGLYSTELPYVALPPGVESGNAFTYTAALFRRLVELPFDHAVFLTMRRVQCNSIFGLELLVSHLWFVRTLFCLYMIYPVLELVLFGSKGQCSNCRKQVLLVMALFAKLIMILYLTQWIDTRHMDSEGSEGLLSATAILTGETKVDTWRSTTTFPATYETVWLRIPEMVIGMLIPHFSTMPQNDKSTLDNVTSAAQANAPEEKTLPADEITPVDMLGGYDEWVRAFADLAVCALFAFELLYRPRAHGPSTVLFFAYGGLAPLFGLILWALCFSGAGSGRVAKFLSTRLLMKLGDFAYSFFCLQMFVLVALRTFLQSERVKWTILPMICATLSVLAWVANTLIEEPCGRASKRLAAML